MYYREFCVNITCACVMLPKNIEMFTNGKCHKYSHMAAVDAVV